MKAECLLGQYACIRVGTGPEPLIVLPWINDSLERSADREKLIAWVCREYARDRSVLWISRKRNMPAGYSIPEMAADYASILAKEYGRADVIGLSLGSVIAQELAATYPHLVRRIVLAMAGARLARSTLGIYRHWIQLAQQRRWQELYLDLIARTYAGATRAVFESILSRQDKSLSEEPPSPSDFVVSVNACLRHDSRPQLLRIEAPALVVGGTEDQLMPVELFREMAEMIPNSRLHLFEGAGHGVFAERKDEFDHLICGFLGYGNRD
ncbi:MAG: alpha/beta hydrolase [Phycisphaerales bacterium]|nr:MAG: alpha/beta hydrolase [Phycisphaerales bacterium]